ncbi:cyclic pyranopterin monophosphate synthase MoaC [Sulfolobus metallicus DSM 6482 = JCM 9184]|jgi:cyclic pyranopterin phosphate synthase|uniref:Probable cyclic pyranopterin monophosphate synthase n=2 Tax=Sulfuracidifex metallicus TaxID=47303 RepID=A0A6A9QLG8_SULME|nr:cyclic pyranopterin monophosphate synthase MoaC [Sulfuracidifex metallicus]MUN28075.1 cyclic pyranopterin monophosphate synthase MoaC [Sulfuracidifex metallicus DSM 6482 = JCM 9184]
MAETKMVDISEKSEIKREAIAKGRIKLKKSTVELIKRKEVEKGDVIAVTKTAAILATKKTPELIPMCHPIPIEHVDVEVNLGEDFVEVVCKVSAHYKTGVEMEALTGVSVGLLNVWDMIKKYEKDQEGQYPETCIEEIKVIKKIKSSS